MSNGDLGWYKNINKSQLRGYDKPPNYYDSALPYNENLTNENLGKSLSGSVGHFDPRNMMLPSNLSRNMGAANYQAPVGNYDSTTFLPNQGKVDYAPEEKTGVFENLKNKFTGITGALLNKLPRQDPRQIALTKFYGGKDNLQGGQTIQGGLMAGYNPVSGGLLNTVTGGKFGKPTNFGLQRAYDKRIGTIDKTLAKWEADEDKYAERLKTTQLYARKKQLQDDKAAELAMLNKVTEGGAQIIDGGKTGDGGYSPSKYYNPTTQSYTSPAQHKAAKSFTMKSGPMKGETGYYGGKATGGRVGYAGGEFVDEDINIQGPGFDENIEMAEADPFEMRIQELMSKGLSYEDAYDIAEMEFQDEFAEGPEESFNQEGIASLV